MARVAISRPPRPRSMWTPAEDAKLRAMVKAAGDKVPRWSEIAKSLPGRNRKDVRKRWSYCLNPTLTKGAWSRHEDMLLRAAVHDLGTDDWVTVASRVGSRTGDQCAKRWRDVLDPNIAHERWTPSDDAKLLDLTKNLGHNWSLIATHFPGRRGVQCRNRSHSLSKKLENAGSHSQSTRTRSSVSTARSTVPTTKRAAADRAQVTLREPEQAPRTPLSSSFNTIFGNADLNPDDMMSPSIYYSYYGDSMGQASASFSNPTANGLDPFQGSFAAPSMQDSFSSASAFVPSHLPPPILPSQGPGFSPVQLSQPPLSWTQQGMLPALPQVLPPPLPPYHQSSGISVQFGMGNSRVQRSAAQREDTAPSSMASGSHLPMYIPSLVGATQQGMTSPLLPVCKTEPNGSPETTMYPSYGQDSNMDCSRAMPSGFGTWPPAPTSVPASLALSLPMLPPSASQQSVRCAPSPCGWSSRASGVAQPTTMFSLLTSSWCDAPPPPAPASSPISATSCGSSSGGGAPVVPSSTPSVPRFHAAVQSPTTIASPFDPSHVYAPAPPPAPMPQGYVYAVGKDTHVDSNAYSHGSGLGPAESEARLLTRTSSVVATPTDATFHSTAISLSGGSTRSGQSCSMPGPSPTMTIFEEKLGPMPTSLPLATSLDGESASTTALVPIALSHPPVAMAGDAAPLPRVDDGQDGTSFAFATRQ